MNFELNIFQWITFLLMTFGNIASILTIGKPRKPLGPGVVVIGLLFYVIALIAIGVIKL